MTLLQCGSGREPFQNPRVAGSATSRPSGRSGRPPVWIWLLLPMAASAALCRGAIVLFDAARAGERAERKVLAAGFQLGLAGLAKGRVAWAMRSG